MVRFKSIMIAPWYWSLQYRLKLVVIMRRKGKLLCRWSSRLIFTTDQERIFLRDKKKNYADLKSKTIFLSPVFLWFREDFGKTDMEIIALVARHLDMAEQEVLLKGGFKIDYTKFDWGVNQSMNENELAPEAGTR